MYILRMSLCYMFVLYLLNLNWFFMQININLSENFLKLSFQRGKNNKKSLSQTENCYDWFNFYVFEGLFSCFFRCYQLE